MITSVLVLAALATQAAAFSGTAKYNDIWKGVACTQVEEAYDEAKLLVALNKEQFDTGPGGSGAQPVCGHTITVTHGGKSIVATVVDRGFMGVNNFDLSTSAFEEFADIGAGHIEVTWTWNDGFDPATGTLDKAGLAAAAIGGVIAPADGDTAAAAVSPPVAAGTSATPETTALAAGADSPVAPADPVAPAVAPAVSPVADIAPVVPVVPAASSVSSTSASAPVEDAGKPTGYGGRGKQAKRCAAQL